MFTLRAPAVPYADPWNQPLPERLRMLKGGRQRVAYFYESANNSTFRYRAYNMANVLNAVPGGEYSAGWFFRADLQHVDHIADSSDRLVICRSGYDHTIGHLISRFRARGKPVLFDIDDFVFNTEYTHLIIDTLALDKDDPLVWEQWFAMISRMGQTLRLCDAAITTTPFLARQIEAFSQRPASVVPNFMNPEQLALSAAVFEEKKQRRFQGDGPLCVGYFSGSPSHKHDFAIAEAALASLLAQHPELRLMMVGYIEPGPALAPLAAQIIRQPFHDYVNLQKLIGTVEFNLMPLQSNVFTDSKSELKYFEAAAVGTLSIASPSRNYAAAIEHGHNGYIARAHQWERVIAHALSRSADYEAMALRAHGHAMQRYSCQTQQGSIVAALNFS